MTYLFISFIILSVCAHIFVIFKLKKCNTQIPSVTVSFNNDQKQPNPEVFKEENKLNPFSPLLVIQKQKDIYLKTWLLKNPFKYKVGDIVEVASPIGKDQGSTYNNKTGRELGIIISRMTPYVSNDLQVGEKQYEVLLENAKMQIAENKMMPRDKNAFIAAFDSLQPNKK